MRHAMFYRTKIKQKNIVKSVMEKSEMCNSIFIEKRISCYF